MKKKTLVRSVLFAFLCCIMILGFQTNVKAEAGNYYIKVNKATNVITVYTKDDKPYTAFVCSAGYATPLGTFYTMNKYSCWMARAMASTAQESQARFCFILYGITSRIKQPSPMCSITSLARLHPTGACA